MNIKTELIKEHIVDTINKQIEDFDIDASEIADTVATNILAEIQDVIRNDQYSDCEMVEEIV